MPDTTKKYKIQQKQSDGMLTLHPETDADIVILDNAAAGMSATNVQDAFKEIMGIIDELRGGGLDINGAINEYVVNAGANVNAGDFVEFIQGIVNQGTFNSGRTTYISAVALSDSQVLVAYADSGNSNYGTAVVLAISGTTISVGNKTVFNSGSTGYISAVALNNSQALVAYTDYGNSSYGTAVVLTISGTKISVGNKTVFNNRNTGYISAAALSNSQVLVAYRDSGNSSYGTAVVLTVSGTKISVGNKAVFNSGKTTYTSAVALSHSQALIAYTDSGNSYYGTAVILTISGTKISVGNKTVFNNRNTGYISAAALSNSQVLVAYSDSGNSGYGTAVVLTISGTTISVDAETVFNSRSTFYTSVVALSNSRALVAYSNSGDVLGDYALIGEVIQPATTRDNYVGVAKTSGTSGQTVEVFEVPFSYTVTVTKTNCTNTSVTSPMKQTDTQTITFKANTAYELPETILAVGGDIFKEL